MALTIDDIKKFLKNHQEGPRPNVERIMIHPDTHEKMGSPKQVSGIPLETTRMAMPGRVFFVDS